MADENKPLSELYTVSKARIDGHDDGIGARVLWLINSQTFMLGIYASLGIFMSPVPKLRVKAQMLGMVIPTCAVIIALFTLIDIIASTIEKHKISQNYKQRNNNCGNEGPYPLIDGTITERFLQQLSPISTTVLFLLLWTFLLLHDYRVI